MFNINIQATNIELTESIKEHVHSRISTLEKVLGSTADVMIHTEVGKTTQHHNKGDVFKTDIKLSVDGKQYVVSFTDTDLYAAVDKAKDEIMREIKRTKGRKRTLMERGARSLKKRLKGLKPW